MNRLTPIIISLIIVVLVAGGGVIWFLLNQSPPTNTIPNPQSNNTQTPQSSSWSTTVTSAQSAVQTAFKLRLAKSNPDNIKLKKTVVSGDYALQAWQGDVTGGQALFIYSAVARGWVMKEIGGGEWSVEGLVKFGVPEESATQLLKEMAG